MEVLGDKESSQEPVATSSGTDQKTKEKLREKKMFSAVNS